MRLIDADVLMPNAQYKGWYNVVNAYDIVNCPTIDAEPIRHGHWIEHPNAEELDGHLIPNYECSVCHEWERKASNFCPNCGSRMDEVTN